MAKAPSMRYAVDKALESAPVKPEDRAAVALIRTYATRMDEASKLAEEAEQVAELLDTADQAGRRRLSALATRVAAQTVAKDLGPLLLAALDALGMTLKGRSARPATGGGGGNEPGPRANALDELRARRDARKNRAASVDATSS